MNKDEALKMAIEALKEAEDIIEGKTGQGGYFAKPINACKEALEAEQEIAMQKDPMAEQHPELYRQMWNVRHPDMQAPCEQPVAWIDEVNNTITTVQLMKYGWLGSDDRAIPDAWIKLYTHPHQDGTSPSKARDKEFVTLTYDEIEKLYDGGSWHDFACAIEQELKTKNGFSDVKEKNT